MERLSSRIHLKRSSTTFALALVGLLAGLIGLAGSSRPEMTLGATLLAAILLDALAARLTISTVDVTLHGPPEAVAGEPSEWVLHTTGLRRPVVVTPAVFPRTPRFIVRTNEPLLVTLPTMARGLVRWVVVDMTATGPLGLYQAGRRTLVPLPTPLPVGPRPVPVELDWPTPRAVGFGLNSGAPLGDELFRSIRPYQRGDERRRIHWRSTAHHGRLMVRESDGTGVVALRITVSPGHNGPEADHVTGLAADVARQALARGWRVQLVTADATVPTGQPPRVRNPFKGAHPTVAFVGQGIATRTAWVSSERAVNHQLASAVQGQIAAPPWAGLTCVIDQRGVSWA